jgi:hypothetical protein
MLDVAVAYNRYKFLGFEFLTWLWYSIEENRELFNTIEPELTVLEIGNRLVLENRVQDALESITIKGDDAGLEEGLIALRKGAVVTEMNLICKFGDNEWRLTLKGESFDIAGLKTPESGPLETSEDIEGRLLEKVFLDEKAIQLVDKLYRYFIRLRISNEWNEAIVPRLRKWLYDKQS